MWHYVLNGQAQGPIELGALQTLLRNGAIGGDTLVWRQGMTAWVPARSTVELTDFVASVTPPPVPPTTPPPLTLPPRIPGGPPPLDATLEARDIEQNKILAAVAYLGILFLVPLLAAPHSRFARFHTNQGIVLALTWVIGWVVMLACAAVPLLNVLLIPITVVLGFALHFGVLIFILLGIVHAASGEYKPLPLIGHFQVLH